MTKLRHAARRSVARLHVVALIGLLLLMAACQPQPVPVPPPTATPIPGPYEGEGSPPRIDVPVSEKRDLLNVQPDALEALGERLGGTVSAHYPAYDGDPFFVTLPAAEADEVSAEEVLEVIVVPILEAVGFERGPEALALPPSEGIKMPVADFKGLAEDVAYEYEGNEQLLRPGTRKMIEVFLGNIPPDDEIDKALEMGEGMTFDQFVAGIERLVIQFPYQQVEGDVPIEHTMLLASRWEGQTVTTVRGTLFNKYAIANSIVIGREEAVAIAIKALAAVDGVEKVTSEQPDDGPSLVLLPYGDDGAGSALMRYAYRMILRGVSFGQEGPFLLWLDAETGEILKLNPLFSDVDARGEMFNRDPGVGTRLSFFEVDAASGGQYTLQLSGVLNRVDYLGDGYDAADVSISDSADGSSATLANFNQDPINVEAQALCSSGTNKAFQQVNFFAALHRYYQSTLDLGVFTPFPTSPWSPKVESATAGCNAWSNMDYGACEGYFNAACPDYSDGTDAIGNAMNFGHDNTVVAHELAHNSTERFTKLRPWDWCDAPDPDCPIPVGWDRFHDLSDFWADHFESTNCTGGWVSKNRGGVDFRLNCTNSFETGLTPRAHEVTVPLNPGNPLDHFPEHRSLATGEYAEMQMASAALWQVRLGMRSKCRPSGLPQFGVRYVRALRDSGFLGTEPPATDTGLYQLLYDLEKELVDQWATSGSPDGPPAFRHNGPHTTNKVTAGFAKTGLFLLPYQCLDGDAASGDPTSCPVAEGGENGGDAVIDIDDNDIADDLDINGVDHPEVDFLELGGPAPVFHVWTGPRYRLDGAGGASTFNDPAPCNTQFRVEVSTDPGFAAGSTINSAWATVDTDPTTAESPECYGTWTPTAEEWTTLQAGGALSRIYYRARTRDASDANERLSTQPGRGLWTVSPPYAVLTTDGRSDY